MSLVQESDDQAPDDADEDQRSAWRVAPLTLAAIIAAAFLLMTVVGLATNAEPLVEPKVSEPSSERAQMPRQVLDPARDAPPEEVVVLAPPEAPPPQLPGIVAMIAAAIVLLVTIASLRSLVTGNSVLWRFRRLLPGQFTTSETDVGPDAEELATLAGKLRDRLLSTDDPRLAIKQAYAAVETGFGIEQLARHTAETPLLYLHRVFGRVASVEAPLARLTSLFEVARFSTQPVTLAMRDDAAAALDEIHEIYLADTTQDQLDDACSL